MNPDIKQEWLDELPKHKQTRNKLHRKDGSMCCLGVLCEVATRHRIGVWDNERLSDSVTFVSNNYDQGQSIADQVGTKQDTATHLTHAVQQWSGIESRSGIIVGCYDRNGQHVSLTGLNDTGCTFDQIADVIKYFF